MDKRTFDDLTMDSGRDNLGEASKAFLSDFYKLVIQHFGISYGMLNSSQKGALTDSIKTGYYHRLRNSTEMQGLFQKQEAQRLLKALNKFDKIRSAGPQPETIEEPCNNEPGTDVN